MQNPWQLRVTLKAAVAQVDDSRAVKPTIPVTEEIYQVGGSGLTAAEDAAIYAIVLAGRAALIDAGCGEGTERLLGNLESIGVAPEQVHYLLLTHCHYDHTGDFIRQLMR